MNKKIFVLVVMCFLLIEIATVSNGDEEETEWKDLNNADKFEQDKNKFLQEQGLSSITGNTNGVSYDENKGTITNGKVSLVLSEAKGADVVALEGGGFEIKKAGSFKIGDTSYGLGKGQSVKLYNDGSVGLQENALMTKDGNIIRAGGDTRITAEGDDIDIKGPFLVNTKNGGVVSGEDATIHFPKKLPDAEGVKGLSGNQVYITEEGDFMMKGKVELSIEKNSKKHNYKGEHENTIIRTGTGNNIHIENPSKLGIRTTIARSEHEVVILNKDTGEKETKIIQNRYVNKDGKISTLMKATDMARLNDAKKANFEITSNPGVIIDTGDGKPLRMDESDFVKKNVLISPKLPPKVQVTIEGPSPIEKASTGKISSIKIVKGPATANIEIEIPKDDLQNIVTKYQNYKGPVNERNEDLIVELLNHDKVKITTETQVGGVAKVAGKIFSIFGAKTNPDVEVRKLLKEGGKDAGLTGSELKQYNNIAGSYKVGQKIVFDSKTNPTMPTVSIVDAKGNTVKSEVVSHETINRLRGENVGTLLRSEELKPKLNALANNILKEQKELAYRD